MNFKALTGLLMIAGSVAAMPTNADKHIDLGRLEDTLAKYMESDEATKSIDKVMKDEETRKAFDELANDPNVRDTIEKMIKTPKMQDAIKQSIKNKTVEHFLVSLLKNIKAMKSGIELIADADTRDELMHLIKGDMDKVSSDKLLHDKKTQKLLDEILKDKEIMQQIEATELDEQAGNPSSNYFDEGKDSQSDSNYDGSYTDSGDGKKSYFSGEKNFDR